MKILRGLQFLQGYRLDVVSKRDLQKNIPKNVKLLRFGSITTRQFDFSLLKLALFGNSR